jgi:hypothetical protein
MVTSFSPNCHIDLFDLGCAATGVCAKRANMLGCYRSILAFDYTSNETRYQKILVACGQMEQSGFALDFLSFHGGVARKLGELRTCVQGCSCRADMRVWRVLWGFYVISDWRANVPDQQFCIPSPLFLWI